jgi:hypothetical protein
LLLHNKAVSVISIKELRKSIDYRLKCSKGDTIKAAYDGINEKIMVSDRMQPEGLWRTTYHLFKVFNKMRGIREVKRKRYFRNGQVCI